eukprot:163138-Chlamydomonas_euryale.AAC.1
MRVGGMQGDEHGERECRETSTGSGEAGMQGVEIGEWGRRNAGRGARGVGRQEDGQSLGVAEAGGQRRWAGTEWAEALGRHRVGRGAGQAQSGQRRWAGTEWA